MRRARFKSTEDVYYHITTRLAGDPKFYPLQEPEPCKKLLEMIHFYVLAYGFQLVAFIILGNHYHFIIRISRFRLLSADQLLHHAQLLYGSRASLVTASWSQEAWHRFNHKLFDLSAFMQHLNGQYAQWFNRRYERRGHLWADRFKSPQLLDSQALQQCLFYIELNAVRAGLVRRPEQWKASSAYARFHRQDQYLVPLEEIFPELPEHSRFELYRQRLLQLANDTSSIPASPDEHEADRGCFLTRQRVFTDGLALGQRCLVARLMRRCRNQGYYRRRQHPVKQFEGKLYSLREQRSNARS